MEREAGPGFWPWVGWGKVLLSKSQKEKVPLFTLESVGGRHASELLPEVGAQGYTAP